MRIEMKRIPLSLSLSLSLSLGRRLYSVIVTWLDASFQRGVAVLMQN